MCLSVTHSLVFFLSYTYTQSKLQCIKIPYQRLTGNWVRQNTNTPTHISNLFTAATPTAEEQITLCECVCVLSADVDVTVNAQVASADQRHSMQWKQDDFFFLEREKHDKTEERKISVHSNLLINSLPLVIHCKKVICNTR